MLQLLFYLFLALFVSFLCSIMESVLLSTPNSFLIVKAEEGHHWADYFKKLKNNIDRPLSAILSLNTIAHTIGAAGVGAQAVKLFGEAYFGIVSATLTVLILVITEIIPKTIGAKFWRKLSAFTSFTIRVMIFLTYPLVIMSEFITRLISSDANEKSTSREEISAMASIGELEGILSDKENLIIQNIIKLKNIKVSEIMTPRVVVSTSNENVKLLDFLKDEKHMGFSRIPVYSEKEENIDGYVHRAQIFEQSKNQNSNLSIAQFKRKILVIPESSSVLNLWEKLLEEKEQISIIVNEYGGFSGLVTLEDVIETMFGVEIIDETDINIDMQAFARERWEMKRKKYKH